EIDLVRGEERAALDRHQRRRHREEVGRILDVERVQRLEVRHVALEDARDLDLVDLDLLLAHEVQEQVHRALEDALQVNRVIGSHQRPPSVISVSTQLPMSFVVSRTRSPTCGTMMTSPSTRRSPKRSSDRYDSRTPPGSSHVITREPSRGGMGKRLKAANN